MGAARARVWIDRAGRALFALALAVTAGLGVFLLVSLAQAPAGAPWLLMIAGAVVYLGSHLVRIARLALLNGDARLSLRMLAKVHLFTAAVALAAPFKVGEPYRIVELAVLTRSATRGVALVWLERLFDVVVILLLLGIAAVAQPSGAEAFLGVLLISLGFVLVTLLLLVLLPENLRRVGSYLVRRHRSEWSVGVLWLISEARGMVGRMSQMLRGRHASLFVFTLVIWTLEGLSFGLIAQGGRGVFEPLAGLLSFLSLLTQGETLLTFLQRWQGLTGPEGLVTYVVATQGTLLVLGLGCGLALARARLAASRNV